MLESSPTSPTSPTTRLTLYEDILVILFDGFDTSRFAGRDACARCARVCSLWSSLALRALWKSLSSLLPLCWILLPEPKDAWIHGEHSLNSDQRKEYFNKILYTKPFANPAIWGRFRHYAAFVQDIDCADRTYVQYPLLRALLAHNGQKTFLPHLRSLDWLETPEASGVLALLASSSLTKLELSIDRKTPSAQCEEVLDRIVMMAPLLSSLCFYVDNSSNQPYLLRTSLSRFKRLRVLLIPSGLAGPITDLTTLPSSCRDALEELHYSPGAPEAPVQAGGPAPCLDFPHLQTLKVVHASSDNILAFLTHLRAPDLRSLRLSVRGAQAPSIDNSETHRALLHAVSKASFASTLRRIKFSVRPKSTPGSTTHLMSIIRPLFALPALREVSIMYSSSSDTALGTDGDMLEVATSWKRLESLSFFVPHPTSSSVIFPGLDSLAHFAKHCPQLRSLTIPLSFTSRPSEWNTGSGQTSIAHPLYSFHLKICQWGPEVEPETAARRIDSLFPNLEADSLVYRHPIGHVFRTYRFQEKWDRMTAAWQELRAERESGRNVDRG